MAQGRISGRLLRDDLARDANLTFNTNTLVVDYTNGRVGIGNVSPTDLLTVAGNASVANLQVSNNQIISLNANAHIVLNPNGVGNVDVSSTYINNLNDPIQNQDAATKAYVDGEIASTTFTITDGVTSETVAGGDTVTFNGTANEIEVAVSATDTITVGLPDDVILAGGLTATTTVSATGNVTGGNLLTGGVVNATGNVSGGNLNTAGLVSATGNVIGGNITTAGLVNATGNVTGGNITTAGDVTTATVTATGNVSGGNLITTGLTETGDLTVLANATIEINQNKIGNVADPTSNQDAATKAYVDASASASLGNLEINDTTITSITASDDIIIDAETGVFKISGTTGFVIPVGNTAQRDGSPDTGLTRYNSETNVLEVYDGSDWDTIGDYIATVDSFDGDNSTTQFTMTAESTTDGTIVDINGVVQLPTTAYSVSGNVITFTEAPKSGDKVTTRLLVTLIGTNTQAGGTDTQVQFNDSDVLAGDSGFTFNKTTNAVTVTGNITGANLVATGNVDATVDGYDIGYRTIPQISSGNVTLALTDSGKHYYSTTSATETITIPPNSSVAFATGTAIMLVNKGTGNIAVARGSGVSLYLAGNATSANRTVTTYGMATLIKTGTDEWFINGTGVE